MRGSQHEPPALFIFSDRGGAGGYLEEVRDGDGGEVEASGSGKASSSLVSSRIGHQERQRNHAGAGRWQKRGVSESVFGMASQGILFTNQQHSRPDPLSLGPDMNRRNFIFGAITAALGA